MPKCILVCENNLLGQTAFDALNKSGIEVLAIWCTDSSKFRALLTSVRLSKAQLGKRQLANILAKKATRIEQINRPFLQNLNEALTRFGDVDFILSAGTGIIFPRQFLDNLSVPIINLHPALLPAYRGPKPTQAMILNGDADKFGGMTAHILRAEIDAGPIIKQNAIKLSDFPSMSDWGKFVYAQCYDLVENGILPYLKQEIFPFEQDESKSSYFSMDQVPAAITANMTFAEAENFAQKAPWLFSNTKLSLPLTEGKERLIRVFGAPINLGSITGRPAQLQRRIVELDLQDARVQFQISHWMRRRKIKIAHLFKSVPKIWG